MIPTRLIFPLFYFIVFPLFSPAQSTIPDPSSVRTSEILEEYAIPGGAVILIQKDSVVFKDYFGYSDLDAKTMTDKNTLFGIGSISKTFLATTTMIAQERGQLDIHSKLEDILPQLEFQNNWKRSRPIRLVHLLEHTSAFDDAHFNLFAKTDSNTPFEEIAALSKNSLTTQWPAGAYFSYNNLGYLLAAHAIEESINLPYEQYIKENLFLPIGMPDATFHPQSNHENLSKGYAGTDFKIEIFPSLPQWPAGSLLTNLNGMENFLRMFLQNGVVEGNQILTTSSIKLMETPETSLKSKNGVDYGYGKGLMQFTEKGFLFYGHNGQIGGFSSDFGYSRDLGLGYVILLNNRDGNKAIEDIKAELLKGIQPKEDAQIQQIVKEFDLGIEGGYRPITSSLSILHPFLRIMDLQFIEINKDSVFHKSVFGDSEMLYNIRGNEFKRKGEPLATSVFVKKGKKWLWLDDSAYEQVSSSSAYIQFYTALTLLCIMLIAFIILSFTVAYAFLKERKKIPKIQLFTFYAILFFLLMIVSIFLFDASKLYSIGAIVFFLSSWLFLIFSFLGLLQSLRSLIYRLQIKPWVKYSGLITSLSCSIVASYLLYWDIVGLRLWAY